eukprot:4725989-Karenia_brevis.AAC.1
MEAPRPISSDTEVWEVVPRNGLFEGKVWLDGSALNPADSILCRAGWSIVSVGTDGQILGEVYGPLAWPLQESGCAELFAFVKALRLSVPPITVYTDYQGLIDGLELGRSVITAPGREYADMWKVVCDAVDDFGIEAIQLIKVKSHVSERKVRAGEVQMTWQEWKGNQVADKAAKKGAKRHPADQELRSKLQRQRAVTTQ